MKLPDLPQHPHIFGAYLVSAEGLPITDLNPDQAHIHIAAITSGLLSAAERMEISLSLRTCGQVIIRGSKGSIALFIEDDWTLVLVLETDPEFNLDTLNQFKNNIVDFEIDKVQLAAQTVTILSMGDRALQEISSIFSLINNELKVIQFKFKDRDTYFVFKEIEENVHFLEIPKNAFDTDSVENIITSKGVQNTLSRIHKIF